MLGSTHAEYRLYDPNKTVCAAVGASGSRSEGMLNGCREYRATVSTDLCAPKLIQNRINSKMHIKIRYALLSRYSKEFILYFSHPLPLLYPPSAS
jgi:hypothetical protein